MLRSLTNTVVHLVMIPTLALALSGCGEDPCVKLERRVCVEKKDKTRCKIIQDPVRREHLSSDACESMLKALKR